jgi:hypothetical protein
MIPPHFHNTSKRGLFTGFICLGYLSYGKHPQCHYSVNLWAIAAMLSPWVQIEKHRITILGKNRGVLGEFYLVWEFWGGWPWLEEQNLFSLSRKSLSISGANRTFRLVLPIPISSGS